MPSRSTAPTCCAAAHAICRWRATSRAPGISPVLPGSSRARVARWRRRAPPASLRRTAPRSGVTCALCAAGGHRRRLRTASRAGRVRGCPVPEALDIAILDRALPAAELRRCRRVAPCSSPSSTHARRGRSPGTRCPHPSLTHARRPRARVRPPVRSPARRSLSAARAAADAMRSPRITASARTLGASPTAARAQNCSSSAPPPTSTPTSSRAPWPTARWASWWPCVRRSATPSRAAGTSSSLRSRSRPPRARSRGRASCPCSSTSTPPRGSSTRRSSRGCWPSRATVWPA